jgi:cell division protein WhiA
MDQEKQQLTAAPTPSFTIEVKDEICARKDRNTTASLVLLSGFIKVNGNLLVRENNWVLNIKTDNPKIAKTIFTLIKDLFKAEVQIILAEQNRFRSNIKSRSIIVEISSKVKEILKTLQIYDDKKGFEILPNYDFLSTSELKREYLTGIFLASGSVNAPSTSNYHLEVTAASLEHADLIIDLLSKFYISAKITDRRNRKIVYIKKSDAIGDFLKVVSSFNALMKFENVRIQRDQVNSANRIYNCDIANEMKAMQKGLEQQSKIKYLDSKIGIASLDPKYQRIAELRLTNPDACLSDLVDLLYQQTNERISKSGLNHRLQKIVEIADKLKGGK